MSKVKLNLDLSPQQIKDLLDEGRRMRLDMEQSIRAMYTQERKRYAKVQR